MPSPGAGLPSARIGRRGPVAAPPHGDHDHAHRAWADIRAALDRSRLDADVKTHAIAIFELLAQAEAQVHGVEARFGDLS